MQVILMSNKGKAPRTLTITKSHFFGAAILFAVITALVAWVMSWSVVTQRVSIPGLEASAAGSNTQQDKYLQENLNALAVKIGVMQAQLVRLDALGERVSNLTGIKPQEFNFKQAPGRGGLEGSQTRSFSLPELKQEIDKLSQNVDTHADVLGVLESNLMTKQVQNKSIPTVIPVDASYDSSGYGWRIDPFSGKRTKHDGIDFVAPTGTTIVAAAGGIVSASEWHHQYGNMVDIDHGNGLSTRYGHASKVFVKAGDLVKAGQKIAEIGSTGRSTGAHLHFEVHVNGDTQDPNKFLKEHSAVTVKNAIQPTNLAITKTSKK